MSTAADVLSSQVDAAVPAAAPRRVAAYTPDLFFSVRVADVIRALGGLPDLVDSAAALWEAVERWPALVLIDLRAPDDWQSVVQRAKNLPHTRLIPIVAFGSHVDTAALAAARRAGCDHAWAKSHFMEQLPALVKRYLQKSPQYVEGWDAPPSVAAVEGFEAFNAGHYWEQHELLESAWREESRPVRDLYQGILQVGVALHQIEQGKWTGAIKLLRRGLNRLDWLPPVCMGVDLASFRRQAHALHQHLMDLSAAQPDAAELALARQIDRRLFPQVAWQSTAQPDIDS